MDTLSPTILVQWLRATGEPTRLRLLALCGHGSLSVSDLADAIGQSEPRVSRHLRILTEAGLIERERQGQWVHYRVARAPGAASFVAGLLAQLDRRDATLALDRSAARAALAPESAAGSSESRLGRTLAGFVANDLAGAQGPALVIGVSHPELFASAAAAVQPCTVLAPSRRAAQGARAFAARHSLRCRVLEAGTGTLSDADAVRAGAPFGALLLDHPGARGESLAETLAAVRRALLPQGRVWLFERYAAFESAPQRVVEHPLARLRRVLAEAGLACERLSPLEADGEHVLAALARPLGALAPAGSTQVRA
jgi:DNA-binding transcriptional ArsR family regulator